MEAERPVDTANAVAAAGAPENPLVALVALGQSIWLDYITRDLVGGGELRRLIEQDGLPGMTSNPTIFQKANVMIKAPGTAAGIPAVRQLLAEGLNVNIALLFARERHEQVMWAYVEALEQRAAAGQPIDPSPRSPRSSSAAWIRWSTNSSRPRSMRRAVMWRIAEARSPLM